MYFFFHLLTGLVIGCLVGDLLHDRRWILPCTAGAVLPDLIDKPVGYLLFPATIGYGRIYAHTLLIALIILAIGLILWRRRSDPGVFSLGIGILSHQILDQMWRQPKNWYFPFLGPFHGKSPDDYLFTMLFRELSNPLEIALVLILLAGLVLVVFRHMLTSSLVRHRNIIGNCAMACAFLFCILAGMLIGQGMFGNALIVIELGTPEEQIISGIVLALAAYLLWRWQERLCTD